MIGRVEAAQSVQTQIAGALEGGDSSDLEDLAAEASQESEAAKAMA